MFSTNVLASDNLVVHNTSNFDLVICLSIKLKTSLKCEKMFFVGKHDKITIPHNYINKDLLLLFFEKNYDLNKISFPDALVYLQYCNISNCIYILDDNEQLIILDKLEYELYETIRNYLDRNITYSEACEYMKNIIDGSSHKKYTNQIIKKIKLKLQQILIPSNYAADKSCASIFNTSHISDDEYQYIEKRRGIVQKTLEGFLNRDLSGKYIPQIALAISGGGFRALIGGLGTLVGTSKINLFNALSYISCLSGSTWLINTWLTLGGTITEFKEIIIPKLKGLFYNLNTHNLKLICNHLLIKYSFDQKITLVDIYGDLLANALLQDLENIKYFAKISDQQYILKDFPLPIYSIGTGTSDARESWWYEVTPFHFGCLELSMFIPLWAAGRKFENGYSVDLALEQSIGFYMGACGSAFSARLDQLYEYIFAKTERHNFCFNMYEILIKNLMQKIGKKRITSALMFNFTYHMDKSPIKHVKWLKLVDPAFVLNLPYPPLSGLIKGRKPDIIFLLDFSTEVAKAPELIKLSEYCIERALPFPNINIKDIKDQKISIFKDEVNPNSPVIIYMPRIHDIDAWKHYRTVKEFSEYQKYLDNFDSEKFVAQYASTTNFYYNDFEARQWCALMEFNMQSSKNEIAEVINWVIDKKTRLQP